MIIAGVVPLKGARLLSWGDHRTAMALSVAATGAQGTTEIESTECVSISFPNFFHELRRLRQEKS